MAKPTDIFWYTNYEGETLTIPYSDDCTINEQGTLLDATGEPLKRFKKDTGYFVNLPLKTGGVLTINLATLTSIVFKSIDLELNWWRDIKLFFKDDNCYNVHPTNVMHQMYPSHFKHTVDNVDYKVLPGYTRYGISKDGVLHNRKNGLLSNGKPNGDGYVVFYPVSDNLKDGNTVHNGNTRGIKRHRAIGFVYPINKDEDMVFGKDVLDKIINHIDHTPGSDAPSNLEWCTYQQNNMHSYWHGGRGEEHKSVMLSYNIFTRTYTVHPSLIECCGLTGMSPSGTLDAINGKRDLIGGAWRVVYYDEGGTQIEDDVLRYTPKSTDYTKHGTYIVTDDTTGEVVWSGKGIINLVAGMGLTYKGKCTGAYKVFVEGKRQLIPGKTIKLTLPNYPTWLGGAVYEACINTDTNS